MICGLPPVQWNMAPSSSRETSISLILKTFAPGKHSLTLCRKLRSPPARSPRSPAKIVPRVPVLSLSAEARSPTKREPGFLGFIEGDRLHKLPQKTGSLRIGFSVARRCNLKFNQQIQHFPLLWNTVLGRYTNRLMSYLIAEGSAVLLLLTYYLLLITFITRSHDLLLGASHICRDAIYRVSTLV